VFACPPERPLAGAIVAKDARPEVLCASRAEGSLAVLDCAICRLDEAPASGSRHPDNDADGVLKCCARGGIDDHAWKLSAVLTVLAWYRQIAFGFADAVACRRRAMAKENAG
jgi:hypothetical protein